MTTRTQLADPRTVQRASVGRKMNKAEAVALTQQIRATAHGLWRLVAEAYDRKAWQALGYDSWKAYAEDELQMSESRSYQLVDTGRVMRAIAEVAGPDVIEGVVVTARETARIKPHMSTFKKELEAAIKDGAEPDEAVDIALAALPEKRSATPLPREDGPRLPKAFEGMTIVEPKRPSAQPAALFSAADDDEQVSGGRTVYPVAAPVGRKVCPTCEGYGFV